MALTKAKLIADNAVKAVHIDETDTGITLAQLNVTGDITATNVAGTLSTAAQPNITSVGTLSSLSVSGNLAVDTAALFVDATTNNVGLNTTSPANKLHIFSSNPTIRLERDDAQNDCTVQIAANNVGSLLLKADPDNLSTNDSIIRFDTDGSQRMQINSSGHVSIGHTISGARLDVNSGATNTVAAFRSTDAGAYVSFADNTTTLDGGVYPTTSIGAIGNNLLLNTANAERMRIASNGEVGIGMTPFTNSLNTGVIDLANGGGAFGWSKGFYLTGNNYFNTNWKYKQDGYGPILHINGNDGDFRFFTMPYGTAGTAGTPTERMRIKNDGNVGIGTTDPSSYNSYADNLVVATASHTGISIVSGTTSLGTLMFADGTGGTAGYRGRVQYDHNTDSMVLHTAAAERMRITSVGKTQISANVADYSLTVVNAASNSYGMYMQYSGYSPNSTNFEFIYCADSTESKFIVWSNGNVVNRNNSYGAISDVKLKENVVDASPKLDDLMQVQVRNFNYIGDDKKQLGVVAQELEQVFPSMIDESPDFEEQEVIDEEGNVTKERVDLGTTTKSVKYSVFVPMLIKGIQELKDIVDQQQIEIDNLKAQLNG